MRDVLRKPICADCPHDFRYNDPTPKKAMGVMMHMGERFCTSGKKARRFKRGDPKVHVPSWCPRRKNPCELRIYEFKSTEDWWLHESLAKNLGQPLLPAGFRYALAKKLTTELSPRDFWMRLETELYQEFLDISLEPYSVVEIDDGIKPVFFYYADGDFTLIHGFDVETARKNKKED